MSKATEWRMVPLIPTQEMCQAGQWKANEWRQFPLRISPIFQAMISAAPQPPAVEPMTDEMAMTVLREAADYFAGCYDGVAPRWQGVTIGLEGHFTAAELRAILHFAPKE